MKFNFMSIIIQLHQAESPDVESIVAETFFAKN